MDNETRLPREYELMTILLPDMPEEDNQAALERVRTYITSVNAEIKETLVDSPWGRRRLAYPIRHEGVDYRDGFYTVIHFTAAPSTLTDVERELKLDTNVMRYLLVTHDPKAGEKVTDAPEGAAGDAAPAAGEAPTAEAAPASTTEAPVAETAADTAIEEAPVETASAAEEAAPAADETEAAVEEAAATIEGEDEPAPADAPETADKEA